MQVGGERLGRVGIVRVAVGQARRGALWSGVDGRHGNAGMALEDKVGTDVEWHGESWQAWKSQLRQGVWRVAARWGLWRHGRYGVGAAARRVLD